MREFLNSSHVRRKGGEGHCEALYFQDCRLRKMAAIDSKPSAEFPSSKSKERNALTLTALISRTGTHT